MGIGNATGFNALLDQAGSIYLRALGNSTAAFGIGQVGDTYGSAQEWTDLQTAWLALAAANFDLSVATGAAIGRMQTLVSAKQFVKGSIFPLIDALNGHCRVYQSTGVYENLNEYLGWLNTEDATKWQALQDYVFRDIFEACYPNVYPDPWNCYCEILQGTFDQAAHLYALGLGRFVASGAGTGTFTGATVQGLIITGPKIDETKYCGGTPKLKVSGLTGSGNVTVTGTAFDPDTRTAITGRTWITSISGNGTTPMTIGAGTAPTDSLITAVTNITIAAGISAGTFYVEAHRPSGRSLLPA